MINIRDISVKNKLIMIQVFTCAIILGLCCFAFVLIGIKSYKESQLNSLSNIVNVLASNSISSLEFDDNEAATELLKGLNVDESVLSAEILTKKGDFFAGYTKTKADTTQFAKKIGRKCGNSVWRPYLYLPGHQ